MHDRLYTRRRHLIQYGLLLLFFSTVSFSRAQTTYYVASTGSDDNDGRSTLSPFQSLSRVNKIGLQAGDVVLFRRGDTFRGTLIIRQSGTVDKPIRFDAYGSGLKPVLAGSVPVRNWSKIGTNRWQAYCQACGTEVTGVFRNGVAQPLGRFPNPDAPNRGSLTVQAHVDKSQLTSQQTLTSSWVGGEAVVRPTYWIIDRAIITQQSGNTLTLNNLSTYGLTDNWGFFIQNHPATLDQAGEWYYNPATQFVQIYDDQGNPNDQLITATATNQVVDIANASFVSLLNLNIVQARTTNLYALNVGNLVLDNDDFTDSGLDGVIIQGSGSTILIDNSTITNSNNNGLYIGAYQNVTVRRSSIRRIGLLPGRGKSGDGQFTGFQSFATHNTFIENNIIDSVGYNGISVQNNTIIRRNQIANFCITKSDGGGIYLWNGAQLPMSNIRIQSNIIRRGIGTTGSLLDSTFSGAHGIFLDDCVEGTDILDNTISDCQGLGIYLHSVSNVTLLRNTCFNNSVGQLILYNYEKLCLPRNNVLRQNVLVAQTALQPVVGYISGGNDLAKFGVMAHNYYARPFNDISTVRAVYNQNVVGDLSLSQWQAQLGLDLTSRPSPITYKEYVLKSLSTTNLIPGNTAGWDSWSVYNNGQATSSAGSQLVPAGLTISFSSLSGHPDSYIQVYKSIKAVARSKSYLLRFDAATTADTKIVVFIRQRQSPYQDLTRRYDFMVGASLKSYEFALTALADDADALLTFQVGEDGHPVSLANIRLQDATVGLVKPADFIRLVYNPTQKDSVVVLASPYRDVKNHYYGRQFTLKAFTSVVLLRDSLPPVDVSLTVQATPFKALSVGAIISVSLTLHSTSASSTLSSQVQWSCQLPAGLKLINELGLVSADTLVTGIVQHLVKDTTFVFRVKTTAPGLYTLAAQVTASTYADPDSTPDSGTDDGEDDQASLTLFARNFALNETVKPKVLTLTEPAETRFETGNVYPNPTADEFTFVAEDDVLGIRVVDLLGREQLSHGPVLRGQTVRFGQLLPDAHYLLYVQYQTGKHLTTKLLKLGRL